MRGVTPCGGAGREEAIVRVRPVDGGVMPTESSTRVDLIDQAEDFELFCVKDVDEEASDAGAVAVAPRAACARRAGCDARSCLAGALWG